MPPRKAPSINTLSPPDTGLPPSGARSPGATSFPRSASPSTGFTQFFSKPTKWFQRSNSSGAIPGRASISSVEPRASSSSGRKPKISHPTDPRPILDQLRPDPVASNIPAASRSVLDLSLSRTGTAFEVNPLGSAASARSQASPSRSLGLGDLRNISRKPWSKSADDLGKVTPQPSLSPIDTSFQDKVVHYRSNRNDSVGSSSTPTSHSPHGSTSYPFPTITTNAETVETPSSSPPQRASPSPIAGGSPLTPSSAHVHSRSHSFTPRLPSKLASPKLGLVPPSPKRKASAPSPSPSESETSRDAKPVTQQGGSFPAGSTSRAAFPFSFGGSASGGSSSKSTPSINLDVPSPLDRPGGSSALLAPPTIIEPSTDGDSKSEKRTSQLVYHASFVNRLTEFSPSALNARPNQQYGGALAKGWKPFKLVLKGSKLYFYKPPGDRSAAIKELFPTELVVVLEDEGLADEDPEPKEEVTATPRSAKGKERDEWRRKRAFWGNSTHPALVLDTEGIKSGTLEALVHEAVFSTTFTQTPEAAEGEEQLSSAAWQAFSAAMMFALPSVVDQQLFEVELRRCSSMLVDSANATEESKASAVKKVEWLAEQYLTFYGVLADPSSWEEWRSSTVPDFPSDFRPTSHSSGLPASSSTQAVFTQTPEIASVEEMGDSTKSPNFGTFSPRPNGSDRLQSLLDALAAPAGSVQTNPTVPPSKSWHATLENGGLTRDLLLALDPQLIARSFFIFNQRVLERLPANITVPAYLSAEIHTPTEGAADEELTLSHTASILAPFLGNEEHPHWLTKLILLQVLISDAPIATSNTLNPRGRSIDERGSQPRAHSRSEVISAWARIGDLCRRTGDECSWRAIFAALCSHPLARLDKVWKRVDGEALRLVQSWVYPHDGNEPASVSEVKHIPWAGERVTEVKEALDAAEGHENAEWDASLLIRAWQHFEALRRDVALCSGTLEQEPAMESEDVEALVKLWSNICSQGGPTTGLSVKLKRIDQFMSLSLAAEPRRRGLFEPYYWTRPQHSFHPLIPLLFPEPLPTTAFINRALVQRGRLESTASSVTIQELQQLRDSRVTHDLQRHNIPEPSKAGGVDLGGTVIVVYDGELMLLVQAGDPNSSQPSSRAPSRPPSSVMDSPTGDKTFSRNPSVRVKPGSKGLDRKPSQLRRSSLPVLSRTPSFEPADIASERPLRVVVQAGTIERLVSVLVEGLHGVSVSVADDNGEMPLNDRKTRELRVDMRDFSRVWWSTFRSFMTPHVFFELLRKKYMSAQIKSQAPSPSEVAAVVRARSEVLETINRWIHDGGGAQDALDDSQLLASFVSFFRHPTDHAPPEHLKDSHAGVGFSLINENRKAVYASFIAQTMRPIVRPSLDPVGDSSTSTSYGPEPPNIDAIEPDDLVGNLDAMAAATFRNVTQEDLFVTADILEVQCADRTGWFPSHEPSAISDEVEIQSIHAYLQDVEPSPMISELSQDSLYRLLPPAIRGCVRAFMILRKWLIAKLITARLGLRTRQARMELVLKAIEVSRLRNAEPARSETSVADKPCIRSFVEAVLVSAAVSVESRMYHRAWQMVAIGRGATCDMLSALLHKAAVTSAVSREPLTVDMGWLIERMIEIISLPDVVEQDGMNLVNLDKRRSLHTLVTNACPSGPSRKSRRREISRRDFDRLNRVEAELSEVHFDLRLIREDAYREAAQSSASLTRKQPRPFQALVNAQQEKHKRDRALRDKLSREKRHEQHKQDKRDEYLNKAMNPRRSHPSPAKQHRNKKSMSSAFLHFMRPISSAFTSDTPSSYVKRTPAELDFPPTHKPAMVLNIVDARVFQFINNERSFTFQLDTEDGGHYLLQTIDKADMKRWIETIERVSKLAAKRRLTYLGHNSKMQLADHLLGSGASPRDPRAVFGVDLETLLLRESPDDVIQPGAIPSVVHRLITEVESRGLTEIGIYRLAGAHSEVNALKEALNKGEWPIDRYTDINTVCDLLKGWFRALPGGMFPAPSNVRLMDAASQDDVALDAKLVSIRHVVHELPQIHFDLLKRLVEHLDKVTDYEENNQMTAESLATVFSPNLLRSADDDVSFFFANMSAAHKATKTLITHAHTIFNEAEPDLDVDQDGESEDEYGQFDAPIPEEDEEDSELLSAGHEASDEDDDTQHTPVISQPPVLDFELPSPCDFSVPMPT